MRFRRRGTCALQMGSAEPVIAFATRTFEPPGLEIRVNFGLFAGREATPAEIDGLAEVLRDKVHDLTIVAEDRRLRGPMYISVDARQQVNSVTLEASDGRDRLRSD